MHHFKYFTPRSVIKFRAFYEPEMIVFVRYVNENNMQINT